MTVKRFIIREEQNLAATQSFLAAINYSPESPYEVSIGPYKKRRSLEMNNLYWDWVTTIGDDLGYTKEEMHEVLMRKFLAPRVMEIDGEQVEVYSTRVLKVREMSEYMEHIARFAAEMGIALRHPEDRAA